MRSSSPIQKEHFWRKDITGLRAVAVLPVLFFHAFPQLIPGGFFGVDIFFVISGYLISGIIFRGLTNDSFSYIDFYVKRIKRILPNLVAVLLFVVCVGWFFLSAGEFVSLGKHVYSSAAFYQNFRLLSDVGYFDLSSNEKPLLHLWSLAIEEQFYIVFPILCTIIWKLTKRSNNAIGLFVALITAGSFALCLLVNDNTLRFYFPLTRFWELGIGICIAYVECLHNFNTKNLTKELRNALSFVGLAMILASMGLYHKAIPTPGLFSLLPVMGSALLIIANDDAVINRSILSWKGMAFIGLISYSLYLWHWPLISYLHIVTPNAPQWHFAVALLLSFPLSIFAYSFIENPIRRSRSKTTTVVLLLAALIGCIAIGQSIKKEDGFTSRPIAQAMNFANDFTYTDVMKKHTVLDVPVRISDTRNFPEILFVGDSHVEQYASRAKILAEQTGKTVVFLTGGGCIASIGAGGNDNCKAIPRQLQTLLQDDRIKTVVIGQIWGAHMHEREKDFYRGVQKYIELIEKFGKGKKVFVLLDCPWDYGSYDLKKRMVNRLDYESFINTDFSVDYPKENYWKEGNSYVETKLSPYASIIKTEHLVCPEEKCDLRNYKDDDHLRSSYVERNAFWIDQTFR